MSSVVARHIRKSSGIQVLGATCWSLGYMLTHSFRIIKFQIYGKGKKDLFIRHLVCAKNGVSCIYIHFSFIHHLVDLERTQLKLDMGS